MKGSSATINVETIEDLTLHSLDRSLVGLDELAAESRQCADSLEVQPAKGLQAFGELAENLHGFEVFRGEVVSIFGIAPATIRDEHGDMEACEAGLRTAMDRATGALERRDLPGLAQILRADLPNALLRFRELIPAIAQRIATESAQQSLGRRS